MEYFLYRLFCPKEFFLTFVFISIYTVLNIIQKIHSFTYQNHYFIDFCCLLLKIVESLISISLMSLFTDVSTLIQRTESHTLYKKWSFPLRISSINVLVKKSLMKNFIFCAVKVFIYDDYLLEVVRWGWCNHLVLGKNLFKIPISF